MTENARMLVFFDRTSTTFNLDIDGIGWVNILLPGGYHQGGVNSASQVTNTSVTVLIAYVTVFTPPRW